MTDMRRYAYSVLRYTHDFVTGEFVNIGIVFYAPPTSEFGPFLQGEVRKNFSRIGHVFPNAKRHDYLLIRDSITRAINAYKEKIHKNDFFREDSISQIIEFIQGHDSSALSWSDVVHGKADDLGRRYEYLLDRMVLKYDKSSEKRLSDDDVWRPVLNALKDAELKLQFEERRISGRVDDVTFKHAWKNGRWHAFEPLSFDLVDADNIKDKARKWLGNLTAVYEEKRRDELNVNFIVAKPTGKHLIGAYDQAVKILKAAPNPVQVYDVASDVPKLVDELSDKFEIHNNAKRA